jgi:hypothetical protein
LLSQKFRHLSNIHRNPPRFIPREQFRRRAPSPDNETGKRLFVDRGRRNRKFGQHIVLIARVVFCGYFVNERSYDYGILDSHQCAPGRHLYYFETAEAEVVKE